MSATVMQMTPDKLRELIESSVEHKLFELLGDPDADLTVRKSLRQRLARQRQRVAAGERGSAFEEVISRLRLKQ